jgi:hypothetical protein
VFVVVGKQRDVGRPGATALVTLAPVFAPIRQSLPGCDDALDLAVSLVCGSNQPLY